MQHFYIAQHEYIGLHSLGVGYELCSCIPVLRPLTVIVYLEENGIGLAEASNIRNQINAVKLFCDLFQD